MSVYFQIYLVDQLTLITFTLSTTNDASNMKAAIFTLVMVISFLVTTNAQTTVINVTSKSCQNDAKIKTINKFFCISYSFISAAGVYQKGEIGYSCVGGIPNMESIKADIARKNGVAFSKVTVKVPSAICRDDFDNFFRAVLNGSANANNYVVFHTFI